jgi:hypothetical protein
MHVCDSLPKFEMATEFHCMRTGVDKACRGQQHFHAHMPNCPRTAKGKSNLYSTHVEECLLEVLWFSVADFHVALQP